MSKTRCSKHEWAEVRWGRIHCANCPKSIPVARYEQILRAAATAKAVRAARREGGAK